MNERNVNALLDVLAENWTTDVVELARRLAARGVLVPASLTEEQAGDLVTVGTNPGEWRSLAAFRAELERIAKGA